VWHVVFCEWKITLLTHLLEAEPENYLRESYRLLRAGGAMMHSHFNIEYPPAADIDRSANCGFFPGM
jgi:predicted SAM-dependent methyltransferase